MTIQEATVRLNYDLRKVYEKAEAEAISDWIIEHLSGLKNTDRLIQKQTILNNEQETELQNYTARLLTHEPVQYVLNEAWFCGLKFYVDKNVLIPRPETEELVEWVITGMKFPFDDLSILDIGSGSGCIAIALKRKLRKATVHGCDISEGALGVAKKNAAEIGVDVNFFALDFLNKEKREQLSSFDIIISNPPYITEREKWQMGRNVLNYEPHSALFAPADDALAFYRAIADFGKNHLNKEGVIYLELNEHAGKETMELFQSNGYAVEVKKDIHGKERMMKAMAS